VRLVLLAVHLPLRGVAMQAPRLQRAAAWERTP
jgi:hypothetical protein